MKAVRFGLAVQTLKVGPLLLLGLTPAALSAQDGHGAVHGGGSSAAPTRATNAFVEAVRDATRRFQDPNVAMNEGYVPTFGCGTGSSEGVMGAHFVNCGRTVSPAPEIARPETLVCEPLPRN